MANMFLTLGLAIILLQSISNVSSIDRKAQHPNKYHFESYFLGDFLGGSPGKKILNGVPNLVAYLNFPKKYHLFGTVTVTLTGGHNWEATHGILQKRFYIIYEHESKHFSQITEITASAGLLPSQWKIGDLDGRTLRLPIYHLVATGNILIIKLEGTTIHEYYPSTIITISDPVVANNTLDFDELTPFVF